MGVRGHRPRNGATFGLVRDRDRRARARVAAERRCSRRSRICSGPGRTAEMTYYEHPSGAKVFSAGALDFGGQILLWPQTAQLLENVWHRLA